MKSISLLYALTFLSFSFGKVVNNESTLVTSTTTLMENEHFSSSTLFEEIPTEGITTEEVEDENDIEEIKSFDYLIKEDDKAKNITFNEIWQSHKHVTGSDCTKSIYCSVRFTELTGFKFNGYNCRITKPTAGNLDTYLLEGFYYNGKAKFEMTLRININGRLTCKVNGVDYETVRKVKIDGMVINNDRDFECGQLLTLSKTRNLYDGVNNSVPLVIDGKVNVADAKITVGKCNDTWGGYAKSCDYHNVYTSSNGRCGNLSRNNFALCPSSQCCSKYGYCGTSSDHCGSGCQSAYGKCSSSNSGGSSNGTTTDGRCGSYNGKSCHTGYCCSKYGYCGKTKEYCGSGCQGKFGHCN